MNAINAPTLLKESMATHGLDEWNANLDNSRRRFGVCRPGKKTIGIGRPLYELNSDDEVRESFYRGQGERCQK